MSTRICIYDPKPHFFEAAIQRDLKPNTDKKICGFKSVRISGDGTWWLSNKTKITMVNNTFSHRNLIIVKGTHCKDPASRTDLSKLLSLPLLWSQQDKSPRSLLTVAVEVTGPFCNVRTFVGTQLRSTSHRIKTSDCYRVLSELTNLRPFDLIDDVDSSPLTKPHQQVQRSRSHEWSDTECELDSSYSGCFRTRQPSYLPRCAFRFADPPRFRRSPLLTVIATLILIPQPVGPPMSSVTKRT